MNDPHRLSREALAGYSPPLLARATVLAIGAGALMNNAVQTLSLVGVGHLLIVDFDQVERHNLARSPLFVADDAGRPKAQVVAERAFAVAGGRMRVSYAVSTFEALGLGLFRDVDVAIVGVDSLTARARFADAATRASVPVIEAGFDRFRVHVSTWLNRGSDAPCYRCLVQGDAVGRAPCSLYAKRATDAGFLPAVQTAAAAAGNIAAEAAIHVLHGQGVDGRYIEFDIQTGVAHRLLVPRLVTCRNPHRALGAATGVATLAMTPRELLAAHGDDESFIELEEPFVVAAPCVGCGASVPVQCALARAPVPRCGECAPAGVVGVENITTRIGIGDQAAALTLAELGFRAGGLVSVVASSGNVVVRVDDSSDQLFTEVPNDVTRRAFEA